MVSGSDTKFDGNSYAGSGISVPSPAFVSYSIGLYKVSEPEVEKYKCGLKGAIRPVRMVVSTV